MIYVWSRSWDEDLQMSRRKFLQIQLVKWLKSPPKITRQIRTYLSSQLWRSITWDPEVRFQCSIYCFEDREEIYNFHEERDARFWLEIEEKWLRSGDLKLMRWWNNSDIGPSLLFWATIHGLSYIIIWVWFVTIIWVVIIYLIIIQIRLRKP